MVDRMFSFLILKDTSGTPSWSLSLAVMSFFVTVFLMFFGGQTIDLTIGSFSLKTKIAPIDVGVIAIFFPTSMGLYFARRYTTAKVETANFGVCAPTGIGGGIPGVGMGGSVSEYSDMEFNDHVRKEPPVVNARPRKPLSNDTGRLEDAVELDRHMK